jgi:hypothetical protein
MDTPPLEVTEADRQCLRSMMSVPPDGGDGAVRHALLTLARHRYDSVTEALRTFTPLPPKPFFAARERGFPL